VETCSLCRSPFEVTSEDLAFYELFDVPVPSLCFTCRLQRRMAFYNRRKLYWRRCDFSGKRIFSWMSPDKPYTVYDKDVWYSDAWDPMEFGRAFDFNRPFFEQFSDLMQDVPFLGLAVIGALENSEYVNDATDLKNCYLVYDCGMCQDTLFGETMAYVNDSMDVLSVKKCELCYECLACQDCYNLKFSRFCRTCSDSWFLRDCVGCKNCFGCANLRQQEYHIFNKPVSREKYRDFIEQLNSGSYTELNSLKQEVEEFFLSQPVKANRGIQNTDSTGEWINNSKNAYYCFNAKDVEDCRYCTDIIMGGKNCMDYHVWGGNSELIYNCCVVGEGAQRLIGCCFAGFDCSDSYYSVFCTRGTHNLFGCVGLRKKQYCILNRQYEKEEYEKLEKRIIAHMKETGEWGEFFPPEYSPFGYNESLAQMHYPMEREDVLSLGWNWCDYENSPAGGSTVKAADLPDDISVVSDDILQQSIECEQSGKLFRITKKELEIYRKEKLSLPRSHPDQRHLNRLKLRNPYYLWEQSCRSCETDILTSYPPTAPELIYCEECFNRAVN